ncbi:MAG: lipoprotein-releasing ABC transporter permease subunit [Myxococcota bacterium]
MPIPAELEPLINILLVVLGIPLGGLLLFLFVALCNLCVDGLLFLMETYLGHAVRPNVLLRVLLAVPALVLYPVSITLEMTFFFLVYLGGLPLARLMGDSGHTPSTAVRFVVGLAAPLWLLPASLYLLVRFYGFTFSLLTDLFRRRDPARLLQRTSGSFEAFVGLRYLKARKNQSFISAITLFSILGVMVGVCALVVVLSVMSGFEEDLKSKILGINSHAIVLRYTGEMDDYRNVMVKAKEHPQVMGATPFIYTEVMLSGDSTGSGVILKGIDPETVDTVTELVKGMKRDITGALMDDAARRALLLKLSQPSEEADTRQLPGLLVGEELANSLHIEPGDPVTIVSPLGEIGPMGIRAPKFKRFVVAGVFKTGMYEYDAKFTYTTLPVAQQFFSMGDTVTGVELKVKDIYKASEVAQELETQLGYPYWTRDWMSMNKNLFSALYLEKIVMAIILGMIILVAALNIISTLIMVVIEKGREIAILKAMGANGVQIMKIFMIEGLIIGFIGTTLGLSLGYGLCLILAKTQLIRLNPDVYYLDTLPVQISAGMFAVVALAAMTLSFAATLYPSWTASRQDPVEGLRYE